MGSACACTAVTGTKGEAVTFTRASSGTCLKGSTTTGISNGDMVACSSDQPRVMYGGDGTGPLGLLVEDTRTNLVLRSQELENAAWADFAAPSAPTITANAATAPDNTATAERFQIPATAAAEASGRFNTVSIGGAGTNTCSMWVRGNGTSGTVDLVKYNSGAATHDDAACAYVASGWSYCATPFANGTASTFACYFGNLGAFTGVARGAADVFIWGLQGEAGATPSSYIATAGVGVGRAIEVPYFAASSYPNGSLAATLVGKGFAAGVGEVTWLSLSVTAAYDRLLLFDASANRGRLYAAGGTNALVVGVGPAANVPTRAAGDWAGTAANVYYGGSSGAASIAAPNTQNRLYLGNYNGGFGFANGVIKDVCLDPSPSRCR